MFEVENIKDRVFMVLKKYYITILLFMIASIKMMEIIYKDNYGMSIDNTSIKVILTLVTGAISSVLITSIVDRFNKAKYLYFIIPIIMLLVYFIVLNDINSPTQLLKYVLLNISFVLIYFSVPFINKSTDSVYFTYKVLISLALTIFLYQIIITSILLTLYSISSLFEFTIKEHIFPNIAIFILGFIMPTIFLSLITNKELDTKQYPNFINRILVYVIFPVLTVYTLVLYAYFIKILITFDLPSNNLANLVLNYSIISVIILYFARNIKDKNIWSNTFIKYYPFDLILPIIMMLVAFAVRINQYGLTIVRYYGLLVFVFISISIILFKLKNKLKYIPLTLAILLLTSAFGPLSAMNLSKWSQELRFEAILKENNMLVDNKIVKNKNISDNTKEQIISILGYFEYNHKLSDIDILPEGFVIDNIEEVFGFRY